LFVSNISTRNSRFRKNIKVNNKQTANTKTSLHKRIARDMLLLLWFLLTAARQIKTTKPTHGIAVRKKYQKAPAVVSGFNAFGIGGSSMLVCSILFFGSSVTGAGRIAATLAGLADVCAGIFDPVSSGFLPEETVLLSVEAVITGTATAGEG
jgi:hypothetical protein